MCNIGINTIRIDCYPEPRISDLCLGSCVSKFELKKSGYIQAIDYTIKYTRCLFLNFYIKNNFRKTLKKLPIIIENVRTNFNKLKKTKVRQFSIRIVNIQASGKFPVQINLQNINLTSLKNFELEVGQDIEPPVPHRHENLIPSGLTYLTIVLNKSNKLKIYNKGYFTIICTDCENFTTFKKLLDKIMA